MKLVSAFGAFVHGLLDAEVEIPTRDPLGTVWVYGFWPDTHEGGVVMPVMPLLYSTRCMRARGRKTAFVFNDGDNNRDSCHFTL